MRINNITFKNVIAFIQGNIRYKLYYSRFRFLIPTHILQQIRWRIKVMDRDCYQNGSCKLCGCKTTALQMADKTCEGKCYPIMMSKKEWVFLLKWVALNHEDLKPIFKTLGSYESYFNYCLENEADRDTKRTILMLIAKEVKDGKLGKNRNKSGRTLKGK